MDWLYHHAPVIGLLFFVIFFTGMAIWVFRPVTKKTYGDYAQIPLNDDEFNQDNTLNIETKKTETHHE